MLPRASRRCIFGAGLATSSLIFACGCLWLNSGVRQTLPEPQANLNRGLAMTIENLPGEEWRPVVGWESFYEVSNMGRIKSLPRICWNGRVEWLMPARIMHDYAVRGYRYVTLNTGKKPVNMYVHRLVAMAFIPNPQGKEQVNHIDYNRVNNALGNLEWASVVENARHSATPERHARYKPVRRILASGESHEYANKLRASKATGTHVVTIAKYARLGIPDMNGTTWIFV